MINIDNLPAPDVLAMPSYADVLAENVALFQSLHPDWEPHSSDENMLLLDAFAYRELHLRQTFNNKLKQTLLIFSRDADLDLMATEYGVERLDGEDDTAFLERILMSMDGYSTAGAFEAYAFHARSVSSLVRTVNVYSPEKGKISVAIATYDKDDDGVLISLVEVLDRVKNKLSDKKVRPITDDVSVFIATDKCEVINANVVIYNEGEALSISNTINSLFALNLTVGTALPYSQIIRYLHVDGVHKATALSHSDDIACDKSEIIRITAVNLNFFNTDGDALLL